MRSSKGLQNSNGVSHCFHMNKAPHTIDTFSFNNTHVKKKIPFTGDPHNAGRISGQWALDLPSGRSQKSGSVKCAGV